MSAGTLQGISGSTDLIKVEVVTAVLGQGIGLGQGSVTGRARVAHSGMDLNNFNPGEILVAPNTNADRKSTRLNFSHTVISYAVFCLKKTRNRPDQTIKVIQ